MNMFKTTILAVLLVAPFTSEIQGKETKAPAACTLTRKALQIAVGAGIVYGMFVQWPAKSKPSDEMFKMLLKITASVVFVDLVKDAAKSIYNGTCDTVANVVHDVLPCHDASTSAE